VLRCKIKQNEKRVTCDTYMGKGGDGGPGGKRSLERPRHRWDDNIKMNVKDKGLVRGMNWIDLAEDRDRWWPLGKMEMNLWVLSNSGNFLTS
jgi:hypothetical protein